MCRQNMIEMTKSATQVLNKNAQIMKNEQKNGTKVTDKCKNSLTKWQ